MEESVRRKAEGGRRKAEGGRREAERPRDKTHYSVYDRVGLMPAFPSAVPMLPSMVDHRSLRAWKEARAVVLHVLSLSRTSWQPWAGAVFAQLQRASLSVQLNIAEGYAQRGSGHHVNHFRIAYGSAVETGDLLELLIDSGLLPATAAADVIARNDASQKLTWGLIRSRGGPNGRG